MPSLRSCGHSCAIPALGALSSHHKCTRPVPACVIALRVLLGNSQGHQGKKEPGSKPPAHDYFLRCVLATCTSYLANTDYCCRYMKQSAPPGAPRPPSLPTQFSSKVIFRKSPGRMPSVVRLPPPSSVWPLVSLELRKTGSVVPNAFGSVKISLL